MFLLSSLQLLRLKYVNIPHLPTLTIQWPLHHPSFDNRNNIWCIIQIMELVIK
jgi:hypothetical protein